jgi:hypothetical protein
MASLFLSNCLGCGAVLLIAGLETLRTSQAQQRTIKVLAA